MDTGKKSILISNKFDVLLAEETGSEIGNDVNQKATDAGLLGQPVDSGTEGNPDDKSEGEREISAAAVSKDQDVDQDGKAGGEQLQVEDNQKGDSHIDTPKYEMEATEDALASPEHEVEQTIATSQSSSESSSVREAVGDEGHTSISSDRIETSDEGSKLDPYDPEEPDQESSASGDLCEGRAKDGSKRPDSGVVEKPVSILQNSMEGNSDSPTELEESHEAAASQQKEAKADELHLSQDAGQSIKAQKGAMSKVKKIGRQNKVNSSTPSIPRQTRRSAEAKNLSQKPLHV